jgi:hypothetical protein
VVAIFSSVVADAARRRTFAVTGSSAETRRAVPVRTAASTRLPARSALIFSASSAAVGAPAAAWVRLSTLAGGPWTEPESVVIPASLGLDDGIIEGIRGVVVRDEQQRPVIYPIIEPATHYCEVMTRSEWMPSMVGELI